MWKTFGFVQPLSELRTPPITLRACSACAGDYEDPARTAASDDGVDEVKASAYEAEWESELDGELDNQDTPALLSETDAGDPLAD